MGKLLVLILSIFFFSLVLAIIGIVLWDDVDHPVTPEENESQIPPQNQSAIAELKAMPEKVDDSQTSSQDIMDVTDANNKFAIDFYNEIKEDDGNIFYSPYSISSAVAMTYEGAKGNTSEEIRNVFYFPEDSARRNGNAAIYNSINKADKDYTLNTANALWAEQNYAFLDDYLSTVEQYYGGRVVNMDFKTNSEESRQIINQWVEEQTKDKIKNLLPKGSVNYMTRLVLTNAIYFKGDWKIQFEEKNTNKEDFNSNGTIIRTDMMFLKDDFKHVQFEGLQALEMDYKGEEISMIILLPDETLENISLTTDNLKLWKSKMREKEVSVYLPKFKFETKYSLNENLKNMGMKDAFNPGKADFSGMTGNKDLFITNIVHQAFVEVNEEGTEAAAATGITMGATSIQDPTVFRADHPFIFIIQDKQTGNILFMGRVENPNA